MEYGIDLLLKEDISRRDTNVETHTTTTTSAATTTMATAKASIRSF